jgi:hypothetical protein
LNLTTDRWTLKTGTWHLKSELITLTQTLSFKGEGIIEPDH